MKRLFAVDLRCSVCTGTITGVNTPDVWDPAASYQIISRKSNKLLSVIGGSADNGADLEQRADGGATSQQWQLVSVGGGYYKLKNRSTGKLLDISGQSLADGASAIQWTDNGGTNQHFQIVKVQ